MILDKDPYATATDDSDIDGTPVNNGKEKQGASPSSDSGISKGSASSSKLMASIPQGPGDVRAGLDELAKLKKAIGGSISLDYLAALGGNATTNSPRDSSAASSKDSKCSAKRVRTNIFVPGEELPVRKMGKYKHGNGQDECFALAYHRQ